MPDPGRSDSEARDQQGGPEKKEGKKKESARERVQPQTVEGVFLIFNQRSE